MHMLIMPATVAVHVCTAACESDRNMADQHDGGSWQDGRGLRGLSIEWEKVNPIM